MSLQKWWVWASIATAALGGGCAVEIRDYGGSSAGTGGQAGAGGQGGQGGQPGCADPGVEGCPCAADGSCNPGLSCKDGICIDAFPNCGNDSIDDGETCDDGNKVDEDGCSSTCQIEAVCLVNHIGGDPSVVSSIRVDQDGTMTLADLRVLDGSHTIGLWPFRQRAAARCGRRVYFTLQTSDTIEAVEVTPTGKLLPVEFKKSVPDVAGLLCDEKNSTLFVMSHTDTVDVRAYSIGPSGELVDVDHKTLIFPVGSLDTVTFTMHPQQPAFYVFGGSTSGVNPAENKIVGAFVRYAADGKMTVEQPSVTADTGQGFFHTTFLSTDGKFMGFSGYSGGGFANYELAATGNIPTGMSPTYSGTGFSNGYDAIALDGELFYHSHSDANVSACRFTPGAKAACLTATPATGGLNRLYLAYGGKMLIAASGNGGAIDTFVLEDDKTAPKKRATFSLDKTESFHASALVPCSYAP